MRVYRDDLPGPGSAPRHVSSGHVLVPGTETCSLRTVDPRYFFQMPPIGVPLPE
jgi:hypothetical protein